MGVDHSFERLSSLWNIGMECVLTLVAIYAMMHFECSILIQYQDLRNAQIVISSNFRCYKVR